MSTQVVPFLFQQQYCVRVTVINGKPWFCLLDVCAVLDIRNPSPERFQLDSKGVTRNVTPTAGGHQEVVFVSQPNLYRVIFRSNKPEAKAFQDWVFDEVLPAIHETGRYAAPTRPIETISPCQRMSLQRLVANISDCFHMDGAGQWAGYALIRAEFGVQNTKDLQPEHYAGAVSLLQAAWQQSLRFKGRVMETERRFLRNRFRYHPADFERLEAAASASELTFRP